MPNRNTKKVIVAFLAFAALLAFFIPFLSFVYDSQGQSTFVMIFIIQWIFSGMLWKQKFENKKTLGLWALLGTLFVLICFCRDRLLVFLGYPKWYHPVSFYLYIGLPSTAWWAFVNEITSKKKTAEKKQCLRRKPKEPNTWTIHDIEILFSTK